jgi:DNA-binding beta-propeller fold protein YncE
MLALIYLALAIGLGDLFCRRFYRFVSTAHRWAAATLVGILLSTWFTYLAGLAFAHTAEPLLFADILFFVIVAGALVWLSRKAPKVGMIAAGASGSSRWDWITLAALSFAACVLLIGTFCINKQGHLRISGTATSDLAAQLTFAQSVALAHSFPTAFADYAVQGIHQFLFYFQAGNLAFLGLNLAWSVDVLSVLGLTSMLALVMVLGELLFHSRVVGRLGATFFFFHGFLERLTNFSVFGYPFPDQSWRFWKQVAFVNERHVPFSTGILLLILIFLVDQSRSRLPATGSSSDANFASGELQQATSQNRRQIAFPTIISSAQPALISAKGFVFSGLLVSALPPWNVSVLIATAAVLCCLFVAYGCWRLSRLKTAAMLGKALGGTLAVCILAAGVIDLLAAYSNSPLEVNYDKEPLVNGFVFRNSMKYKIPGSPITVFEGGHGNGKGQFDKPHGLAVDSAGNIFVADTNNGRIEKFTPNGTFVASMGQFEAPSGVAIDRARNIYVAEIGSKHRVRKLRPDGTVIAEWSPGLYGPRKIAINADDSIYVVDSGRNRILKFSPDGQVLASWGSEGTADGQFKGVGSVAVDPTNSKVYVADPVNSRIQVFDSNGKFLSKWSVPEWREPLGFEDLVIDPARRQLYASSAHLSSILVFDLQGNRLGTLTPTPPEKLEAPSALALAKDKLFVLDADSERVSLISLQTK